MCAINDRFRDPGGEAPSGDAEREASERHQVTIPSSSRERQQVTNPSSSRERQQVTSPSSSRERHQVTSPSSSAQQLGGRGIRVWRWQGRGRGRSDGACWTAPPQAAPPSLKCEPQFKYYGRQRSGSTPHPSRRGNMEINRTLSSRGCETTSSLARKRPLHRNVQRFRGGLVFKAQRLLYHSTLGLRVIQKKKKKQHLIPLHAKLEDESSSLVDHWSITGRCLSKNWRMCTIYPNPVRAEQGAPRNEFRPEILDQEQLKYKYNYGEPNLTPEEKQTRETDL